MTVSSHFEIGGSSNRGNEYSWEDRFIIDFPGDGALLGVVNGYGGSEVADVCSDYTNELWRQSYEGQADIPGSMRGLCHDLANITSDFQSQAATASFAYLPNLDSGLVYIAIVGDSPVIVKRSDGSILVHPGHNLSLNGSELTAAVARGGYDMNDGYIRIEPQGPGLPTGRAFGMGMLGPVISKEPDIFEAEIGDFMLLGTIGVFGTRNRDFQVQATGVLRRLEHGVEHFNLTQHCEDNATAVLVRRKRGTLCGK